MTEAEKIEALEASAAFLLQEQTSENGLQSRLEAYELIPECYK